MLTFCVNLTRGKLINGLIIYIYGQNWPEQRKGYFKFSNKKTPSFSEQYQIRQSKYPPLSHVYFEVWKKRKCIFLLCGHCCLLKPIDSPLRPAADEIQVFFLVRRTPDALNNFFPDFLTSFRIISSESVCSAINISAKKVILVQ